MALKTWHTVFMSGLALASAAIFAASCGGGGEASTDGVVTPPGCTRAGEKCALGCDANLGCVECLHSTDCGPGAPFCVLGRCEECGANVNCGTGQACFPDDHTCRTKCASNGDCDGEAPLCDVATGACVGCLKDTDCSPERPVCEPTRAQCSECKSNLNCPAAQPACNLQDGRCVECLIDTDCGNAFLCGGDHQCHAACVGNVDCPDPSRPLCDTTTRACVQCLSNGDCGVGGATPVCRDDGRCVQCLTGADCPTGLQACGKDNQCVECLVNTDCKTPGLLICHNEQCVQCNDDKDCPVATPKCDKEQCVAP